MVLAYAWYRSLPAHDLWLTLLIALCLSLSFYAGVASWHRARLVFRRKPRGLLPTLCWMPLVAIPLIMAASLDLTRYGIYLKLYPADLRGAKFVTLPPDWRPYDSAIRTYRETWCRREGLGMHLCGHPIEVGGSRPPWITTARRNWCLSESKSTKPGCDSNFDDLEVRFQSDWSEERARMLAALTTASLKEKDLRRADLVGAMLIGVDLSDAKLEGADLSSTGVEGARFWGATIRDADFKLIDMRFSDVRWLFIGAGHPARVDRWRLDGVQFDIVQGSQITQSSLRGAAFAVTLSRSYIEGSDLTDIYFIKNDLFGSRISQAVVGNTALARANLAHVEFSDVVLDGSDLRDVIGLTQAQLDKSVGNNQTLLPLWLSEKGQPFYIMSCLQQPDIPSSIMLDFSIIPKDQFQFTRSMPRTSVNCLPEEKPIRTGRPMSAELELPDNHPTVRARNEREFFPPVSY